MFPYADNGIRQKIQTKYVCNIGKIQFTGIKYNNLMIIQLKN